MKKLFFILLAVLVCMGAVAKPKKKKAKASRATANTVSLIAELPQNMEIQEVTTAYKAPKREFRGVWMHTIYNNVYPKLTSDEWKEYIRKQLDEYKELGINVVLFQVRPEADAFYESEYEPWSRFLTGEQGKSPDPFFDPLHFMTEECHKRCMELHAWVNPYRANANKTKNRLVWHHIYYEKRYMFFSYGNQLMFNPGVPESREHIVKVISDIVKRYDIDGIHMDDYFYPYPIQGLKLPDNETFKRYGLNKGYELGEIDRWRRDNVNKLVSELSTTIKSIKPYVKFGISPFGIYRNKKQDASGSETNGLSNYDNLYADTQLWVNSGWLDYIIPQLYWEIGHPAADYTTLFNWWKDTKVEYVHTFIGQDVGRSLNQISKKLNPTRVAENIGGNCFWSGDMLLSGKNGYKDSLKTEYFKHHAIAPNYPKLSHKAPKQPNNLRLEMMGAEPKLYWDAEDSGNDMEKPWYYIVYACDYRARLIDQFDPSRIVYVGTETEYTIPEDVNPLHYKYIVTAVNRMQNESEASQVCRFEE
jgi:uncharacterized lipoprotein YddW (UPF0748 family)